MEGRFIGKSVKRKEDVRLICGRGVYVDDVKLPSMLYAAFVRSTYPHALIKKIDIQDALRLTGVKAILTGEEVARISKPFTFLYRPAGVKLPKQFCLAL